MMACHRRRLIAVLLLPSFVGGAATSTFSAVSLLQTDQVAVRVVVVAVLVAALALELAQDSAGASDAEAAPASRPSALQGLAETPYKEPRVHATKGCATEVNQATDA